MQKTIEFYRAQGVHAPPGYNRLIVGHLPDLRKVNNKAEALIGTDEPNHKNQIVATLDSTTESGADDSYDYKNNTVSILNFNVPFLVVSDPEVVQEMLVSKGHLVDKSGALADAWKNLMGDGFLMSKSDKKWESKRKGLAHAFFKPRLMVMLEKFKEYTSAAQERWIDEIKKSGKGYTKIQMEREMLNIFN